MSAQAQGEEAARIRAVRWRLGLPLLIAAVGLLAAVPDARASFHFMKIREIHTGGVSGGSYVELQMWTGGQNFVQNQPIVVYASDGTPTHTFKFPANVGDTFYGAPSQSTILVAGTGYSTAFPSAPTPDASDPELDLPAIGGAVCFSNASPPDCVSWGNFAGDVFLPAPGAGVPASPGGVTAGKALHRSIAAPCSTLLEPGDDTDDSSADFFERTPEPRSYASPIVEKTCTAPTAIVDSGPDSLTKDTSASFTYHSNPAGAEFECSLDSPSSFTSCDSTGITYPGPLLDGSHTFRVRAKNADGTGSPASYPWKIDTTPPTVTILTHPNDPSPGNSASFTYSPDETVSTFECSLEPSGKADSFSACPSNGKTYPDAQHPAPFADGEWTFKVRATDQAGNQGEPGPFPAGTYSWTVDNSLADTTSPETTITSMPPNPSGSSTASFTYESNEPGSSFKCKLDAAPFAACSALGITYTGLADGTHTFQVRATDSSDNTDPTPAGYTFDVVLPLTSDPLPLPSPPPLSEPEPGTASAAAVAQVRGAFALLRIGCRGQQGARCRGLLRLVARVGSAGSSRSGARLVTVGRGRYNLPAGSRGRVVRARLTPQGRRLVRRAGRRGLRVRLVGKRLEKRVLTLRGAAKRKRTKR